MYDSHDQQEKFWGWGFCEELHWYMPGASLPCSEDGAYSDALCRAAEPTTEAAEAKRNFQLEVQYLPSCQF